MKDDIKKKQIDVTQKRISQTLIYSILSVFSQPYGQSKGA